MCTCTLYMTLIIHEMLRQGNTTQHNRKTKQHNTTHPKQYVSKLAASGGTRTHFLGMCTCMQSIYMIVKCGEQTRRILFWAGWPSLALCMPDIREVELYYMYMYTYTQAHRCVIPTMWAVE